MRIAYIDGRRIDIKDYQESMANQILCAEGHPVIAKRGHIRMHHFAHKVGCPCSCHDNKGEWHIWWQDRVHIDHQEVRLQANDKVHIADILIPPVQDACKGFVIEIQHSPMDLPTMREREAFYTGQGYTLVWVFDVSSWIFTTRRSKAQNNIMVLTKKKGADYPLWAKYDGKVQKIFDFGRRQLLLVSGHQGNEIHGTIISLDQFDHQFLGSSIVPEPDMRPYHHEL